MIVGNESNFGNRIQETVPTWGEIEKRVMVSLDCNDVNVNHAVNCWREQVQKTRDMKDEMAVTHSFTTPEVFDALVNFFRSDIAEKEAIFRMKIAENNRLSALMNLRVMLGVHEGIFIEEEEGEYIAPECFAIIRNGKKERTKQLQKVIEASKRFAQSSGEDGAIQPSFPTSLGEGIQDFASDLTEFINTNGDQGREVVVRICDDHDFAKKVINDDEMPRPLRFLADLVVETTVKNCLPKKEGQIGFGRASC
jgi:hypothetical protein